MTTTTPTTTIDLVASAARACAHGWAEQARAGDSSRWTNPVPQGDLYYLEREVLGRPATEEESAEFSRVFRDEYNACMEQRAGRFADRSAGLTSITDLVAHVVGLQPDFEAAGYSRVAIGESVARWHYERGMPLAHYTHEDVHECCDAVADDLAGEDDEDEDVAAL